MRQGEVHQAAVRGARRAGFDDRVDEHRVAFSDQYGIVLPVFPPQPEPEQVQHLSGRGFWGTNPKRLRHIVQITLRRAVLVGYPDHRPGNGSHDHLFLDIICSNPVTALRGRLGQRERSAFELLSRRDNIFVGRLRLPDVDPALGGVEVLTGDNVRAAVRVFGMQIGNDGGFGQRRAGNANRQHEGSCFYHGCHLF